MDVIDIEAAGGYPCCIIRRREHGSTTLPQACVASGADLFLLTSAFHPETFNQIGIIVEGQEADVRAYTHSVKNGDASKGASDMAIRVLSSAGSEKGFADLTVVT